MSIRKTLGEFRAQTAGIRAVAVTDLSTGTVFVSESAVPMGQEVFDRLAARARTLLNDAPPPHATGPNQIAYEAGDNGAHLFLRDPGDDTGALILALTPTTADLDRIVGAADALFAELRPGGDSA